MDMEQGISNDYLPMDPKRLLERLHTALNTRDLTNLLHCLQVDYEQFYPARSEKAVFTGLEATRQEYDRIFRTYPDFHADLLRQAIEGNVIWTEWRFRTGEGQANQAAGQLDQSGVIIFGVEQGLIAWARIYMLSHQEAEQGAA